MCGPAKAWVNRGEGGGFASGPAAVAWTPGQPDKKKGRPGRPEKQKPRANARARHV